MNIGVTLFGQMITFLLFVMITKRYIFPPLQQALAQRQAKIADGLAAAQRGHHDLALAQASAIKQIKEAKQSALQIVDEAHKQASALIDAAKQQAQEDRHLLLQKSHSEVEQMVAQAKESLRHQVSTLALLGAEKILSRHIDKAANEELLNKLVDEL